ncbi:MAG: LacI family DNA-binding transcriptional regulator [Pyrinomonadaceae bacterium]
MANHLNLSTTTLSLVLNSSPGSSSIPQETKDRIFEAAAEFNYRPNYFARSLRAQKSFTVGVIVAELSDGYSAMVLNGVESVLVKENYFYLTASHLHRDDLLEKNPQILMERQVEGIIAVDTPIRFKPILPVVNVSGHENIFGVTNVILNHQKAAELGIRHLVELGHREIAVIKGQEFSADTEIRFRTIADEAAKQGITIDPELTYQLKGDTPSPQIGYIAARELLASKRKFTALFAFNDISAIGAIRAFRESGLKTPEDISVLGFDDIYSAAYHNPALTTIRQPLFEMGELAAQTLLEKLGKPHDIKKYDTLTVEPQLIIRQSTAIAKS